MEPYDEESCIQAAPLSESVFTRPSMYFGEMDTGDGYSCIVQKIVDTVLWWKPGACITVRLKSGNAVTVECASKSLDGSTLLEMSSHSPIRVSEESVFSTVPPRFASINLYHAYVYACRSTSWEQRDKHGQELSCFFKEGVITSTDNAAPDLPSELCVRASVIIGTTRLPFSAGTIAQVSKRMQLVGSGFVPVGERWDSITVHDERTDEVVEIQASLTSSPTSTV